MTVAVEQVLILFAFIIAGYILAKTGIAKVEHTKTFSALIVYFFLPCTYLNSFSQNCTPAYLQEKYPLILISLAILLGLCLLARPFSKKFSKEKYEQTIFEYSLIIPNFGYIGYALCQGIFGDLALLNMMVFALPLSVYISVIGFNMLTKQTGEKFSWKLVFTPSMIGILLGCAVGISGVRLPSVVTEVTSKAAACTAPSSMLLTGIALSEFDLKVLLTDKRSYILSALRLLGIPMLLFAVLKLLGLDSAILPAVMIYAMPCGMNTIIYPKLIGEDCRIGASLTLISTVLALLTIPLCVAIL